MTDLFDQLPADPRRAHLPSAGRAQKLSPNGKPLGRPPGAKNRRSVDLARYIEATYGGMTPGQQSAEIALVKPKDLARAKALAQELGIVDIGMPPLLLAQVVKAVQLAKALNCDRDTAWGMLAKERIELVPYIHQKQPAASPDAAKQLPTMFVVDKGDLEQAQLAAPGAGADVEILEDFELPADQVAHTKSHDDT